MTKKLELNYHIDLCMCVCISVLMSNNLQRTTNRTMGYHVRRWTASGVRRKCITTSGPRYFKYWAPTRVRRRWQWPMEPCRWTDRLPSNRKLKPSARAATTPSISCRNHGPRNLSRNRTRFREPFALWVSAIETTTHTSYRSHTKWWADLVLAALSLFAIFPKSLKLIP